MQYHLPPYLENAAVRNQKDRRYARAALRNARDDIHAAHGEQQPAMQRMPRKKFLVRTIPSEFPDTEPSLCVVIQNKQTSCHAMPKLKRVPLQNTIDIHTQPTRTIPLDPHPFDRSIRLFCFWPPFIPSTAHTHYYYYNNTTTISSTLDAYHRHAPLHTFV